MAICSKCGSYIPDNQNGNCPICGSVEFNGGLITQATSFKDRDKLEINGALPFILSFVGFIFGIFGRGSFDFISLLVSTLIQMAFPIIYLVGNSKKKYYKIVYYGTGVLLLVEVVLIVSSGVIPYNYFLGFIPNYSLTITTREAIQYYNYGMFGVIFFKIVLPSVIRSVLWFTASIILLKGTKKHKDKF